MNHKNLKTTQYPDPNDRVEDWKDKVYQEIKDLPKDQIGQYLHQKVNADFKELGGDLQSN